MISPVFILCSALLLSGVYAEDIDTEVEPAPAEVEEVAAPEQATKNNGGTELVKDFGVEVLGSLFEGKDLEQALERGGVKVLGTIEGDKDTGKKRLEELDQGKGTEEVVGEIVKEIAKNKANLSPSAKDALNMVGGEKNVKDLTKVTVTEIKKLGKGGHPADFVRNIMKWFG